MGSTLRRIDQLGNHAYKSKRVKILRMVESIPEDTDFKADKIGKAVDLSPNTMAGLLRQVDGVVFVKKGIWHKLPSTGTIKCEQGSSIN